MRRFIGLLVYFLVVNTTSSQPALILTPSEIQFALQKSQVLASVLYIAAHPDDENTGVISYFSKGRKYRTAYLSLTRGDGGQNLIGPEKGAEIGMVRTQELLQARRLDGGEQFFSRAIDFGYSKTPQETFSFWDKEAILADVVWVIRTFRPDIIITRFPPSSSGGHGHHTASAILAQEAFYAAADTSRFSEQLEWVKPWQPKRLYWNSWRPGEADREKLLSINIGEYNPLLATSYSEISALARSMHKSQGFGVTASRGDRNDYFELVEGAPAKDDIFEGINACWERVDGGEKIENLLIKAETEFGPKNPSKSIPILIKAFKELQNINNDYWKEVKSKELLAIIQSCAGLWIEAISDDYSVTPGRTIGIETTLINRSNYPLSLEKISIENINADTLLYKPLKNNQPFYVAQSIIIPDNFPTSQPYWLEHAGSAGLFSIPNQQNIGLAENRPSPIVKITLKIDEQLLEYKVPVYYRWRDRVDGEVYRPLEVRPLVTLNLDENVCVFPDDNTKQIKVKITGFADNVSGTVRLYLPLGWSSKPKSLPFSLEKKYNESDVEFTVTPPALPSEGQLIARAIINNKEYDLSIAEISHPHIKQLSHFPKAQAKLVKLDIKFEKSRIGYIMGAGDAVPASLRNLGYTVVELSDADLENSDLSQFDAIVTGIRAFNTRHRLVVVQPKLLKYVENGGTLVAQYNVTAGLLTKNIGPYPLTISRDRVSVEQAEMTIIDDTHQLLNFPNKITQNDFADWVQERGLYFPNKWDEKYQPVLSCFDPGESPKTGPILFARYGKGVFIYTGLSWFRQLPAGVPGAYRLFVNLISAGKYNE